MTQRRRPSAPPPPTQPPRASPIINFPLLYVLLPINPFLINAVNNSPYSNLKLSDRRHPPSVLLFVLRSRVCWTFSSFPDTKLSITAGYPPTIVRPGFRSLSTLSEFRYYVSGQAPQIPFRLCLSWMANEQVRLECLRNVTEYS